MKESPTATPTANLKRLAPKHQRPRSSLVQLDCQTNSPIAPSLWTSTLRPPRLSLPWLGGILSSNLFWRCQRLPSQLTYQLSSNCKIIGLDKVEDLGAPGNCILAVFYFSRRSERFCRVGMFVECNQDYRTFLLCGCNSWNVEQIRNILETMSFLRRMIWAPWTDRLTTNVWERLLRVEH